ncbi:phospholipase-like protein [Tanacetum coccineum]
MLGRQVLTEDENENENENIHLYYHVVDNFQIQFGREEFCLVTGLKFGVENWTDYNDESEPIPFRRRVFSSSLDGQPIRGKHVAALINSEEFKKLDDNDAVSLCCLGILQLVLLGLEDRRPVPNWILRLANDRDGWDNYPWGSHVWPTLYKQLKDANVRRWPALYATQPRNEDEVEKKSYSLVGFLWAFKGQLPVDEIAIQNRDRRLESPWVFRLLFKRWQIAAHSLIWETPSKFATQFNQIGMSPSNWQTPNASYLGTPIVATSSVAYLVM